MNGPRQPPENGPALSPRVLAQLRAMGVKVEPKVADEFNGRFAWVVDPEGNKIELWEPKAGY